MKAISSARRKNRARHRAVDRPAWAGGSSWRLLPAAVALGVTAVGLAGASPAAAALPYGPDTCKQGYVWREAFSGDHVCVTPGTRAQAADDNLHAAARRAGYGAYGRDTCKQGYVWREARRSDHVCVTPGTRTQTAYDNSQAANRRVRG
ncbi:MULTISPECIES: hypothetical protein [unclassified Pseudofrankia]|uniref:hypothetical protein n=1 Tax=unclassified Pseudofrankia TaxID=2994372 RepID=UPI000B00BA5E|nr:MULTISPECIES: hypothetical protein [unclassified Pseudofrankia]MDT3444194.1 hypothetical protein [Pseudofrankia sp. BMG5.37]